MKTRSIATAVLAGSLAVAGTGMAGMASAAPTQAPTGATVAAKSVLGGKPTPSKPRPKPAPSKPGTAFTAYGNTWRAVVDRGVLRVEGNSKALRGINGPIKVKRSAFAKGVEFTGRSKGRTIALVVRAGQCKDTAGQNTGQRATLTIGKQRLTGCAVPGAKQTANT